MKVEASYYYDHESVDETPPAAELVKQAEQAEPKLTGRFKLVRPTGSEGLSQPYRRLKVEDALAYLDQIKARFWRKPEVYNRFLDIMKEFKAESIDTPGVIKCVIELFGDHTDLLLGFNTFLPPGYRIEETSIDGARSVDLPSIIAREERATLPTGRRAPPLPTGRGAPPLPAGREAPIEFDDAIDYVTKVKKRFTKQVHTYKAFLETLHIYQKKRKPIDWVYKQVSRLFVGHPDLLAEFSFFLPNGSPPAKWVRMAKWRCVARVAGRLMVAWRRATERTYAPGGGGFEACREEFEALAVA